MNVYHIVTPSRLHFGLLGWGPHAPRQFGGVGLMVEQPGIELGGRPSDAWSARGPLAERALEIARAVAGRLRDMGHGVRPLSLALRRAAPEHVGLGTGTQLSLAVAALIAQHAGLASHTGPADWARWTGRGVRSGIGLHGFERGGLIVDGGHKDTSAASLPPLLTHLPFPEDWHVLIVLPAIDAGLHGLAERRAFDALPPVPAGVTNTLAGVVLLGVLPAVQERDLERFGTALEELQRHVGGLFAPAQGGIYAHEQLARVVAVLHAHGLQGVGQSSWGPTLYGFSDASEPKRHELVERVKRELHPLSIQAFWTRAAGAGAAVRQVRDMHGEAAERT